MSGIGVFCTYKHEGRYLIGELTGWFTEKNSEIRLEVAYLTGEPWPVKPLDNDVRRIERPNTGERFPTLDLTKFTVKENRS